MKNYDGLIDIENSPEVQAEFLAGVDQPKPNGKGASKGLPFTLFDDIRATSKDGLYRTLLVSVKQAAGTAVPEKANRCLSKITRCMWRQECNGLIAR
jgi:hypothetical protein